MPSVARLPPHREPLDRTEPPAITGWVRSTDWRLVAQLLVLIVVTCACYWPALNGEFQWDDGVLVKDNQLLRSLAGLRDILAFFFIFY